MALSVRSYEPVIGYEEIAELGRAMVESGDLDPVSPVLKSVQAKLGLTGTRDEEGLWLTVLVQAFDSLPSALVAFKRIGWPAYQQALCDANLHELPMGPMRRPMRGGMVRDYLHSYWSAVHQEAVDWAKKVQPAYQGVSQRRWMRAGWTGGYADKPESDTDRFLMFWDQWQTVPYNGRRYALSMANLLMRVHEFPMTPPDTRLQYVMAIRDAVTWLYKVEMDRTVKPSERTTILNHEVRRLNHELKQRGVILSFSELGSLLVALNAMRQGRYYVGLHIDTMQQQMSEAVFHHDLFKDYTAEFDALVEARRATLPRDYLGEYNGRRTIEQHRLTAYALSNKILTR